MKDQPYIFRHQHGTLTVHAKDKTEAEQRAKHIARGMRIVPENVDSPLPFEYKGGHPHVLASTGK